MLRAAEIDTLADVRLMPGSRRHPHFGAESLDGALREIGMAYLQALEGEVWGKLPAPVYVRGFLAEYARALGLDAERVKQTYLARYKAARPTTDDDDDVRDQRS